MAQFYALDLRTLGAGRAWRLIRQLPPEARVVSGQVSDGWSIDRELLALILEVVDSQRLNFVAANSKSPDRHAKAMRFPRPHDVDEVPTQAPLVDAKGAALFFTGR